MDSEPRKINVQALLEENRFLQLNITHQENMIKHWKEKCESREKTIDLLQEQLRQKDKKMKELEEQLENSEIENRKLKT